MENKKRFQSNHRRRKRQQKRKFKVFLSCLITIFALAVVVTTFLNYDVKTVIAEEQYYGKYSVSYMPITLDGYPIQGYFCDNKILISMDDLTRYGFDMDYDAEGNYINLRSQSDIIEYPYPQLVGCTNFDAVGCTLDTRINGVKIPAYSLDGYACVSVDDLVYLSDDYNVWWGWSDYNMNGGYSLDDNTFKINCFRFRVNDWTALLSDMESQVDKTEMDIYTQGSPDEAVYYGAKLEPRSGVYAGILSDGNEDPEIGRPQVFPHDFGVYSSYLEFDTFQTDFFKPSSYIVPEKNCISQVPWNIADINLALDSSNDEYIRTVLDNMAAYNKPTIIRFGAEMNVGTLGDSPTAYVKAFRKIADMVHEYPNFAVMWSPNDSGSLDRPFWYFYPGDKYVDWVGVSSFSKKDFFNSLLIDDNSEVYTSREAQIYFTLGDFGYTTNSLKYITNFMTANNINKPLAISEGGVVSSLSYNTNVNLDVWGQVRMRNMYWYAAMRYPQLKSIVYFNHDMDTEVIGFDMINNQGYKEIFEDALSSGAYLMSYNETPKFTFVKAGNGRVYNSAGSIPLYIYVYQPEEYTLTVDYILDGNVINTANSIPFKYDLNPAIITDGTHTLTITAHGERNTNSKTYTLNKDGVYIKID